MSGAWSWPSEGDPREPFADPLPAATNERGQLAVDLAAVEAGLAPPGDVLLRAERLGLTTPLAPEPAPLVAGPLPSEVDLVRIATEYDPAVASSAPDVVLGPWADLADRHTRLVAVAWGALFPGDGWDTSPASRYLGSKPGPPPGLRPGFVAVLRTPPAVWEITGVDGDRIEVADTLGLDPPVGPVQLRPPGTPTGAPRVGGWLMARLVPTPAGWQAVTPIVVPRAPAVLARWRLWATLGARAADPRVRTFGDVLRARGHHLARRLLETAWTEHR